MAQFSRTPERSALTGVGASPWASGSHVCMGARPAFVPRPTMTKTKATLTTPELRRPELATILVQSIPGDEGTAEVLAYENRTIPKSARDSPTVAIIRYFQAASIAPSVV